MKLRRKARVAQAAWADAPYPELIAAEIYPHRGAELNAAVNDMHRAILCQQWQEAERDKFYNRKREAEQHGGLSGMYVFLKSVAARDTVAMEQMYHRWMGGYLSMWRARVEIEKELGITEWVDELNALWASRNPGVPAPRTAAADAGRAQAVDAS